MKNSLLFATACIVSLCTAESEVKQFLPEKISDYIGLKGDVPSDDLVVEQTKTPRVKSFGYETKNVSSNKLFDY